MKQMHRLIYLIIHESIDMKKLIIIFLLLLIQNLSAKFVKIDSLEYRLEIAYGQEKVDIFNTLSVLYINKSTEKSLDYCRKASDLAKNIKYKNGEALSYLRTAKIYRHLDEYEQALKYLQDALKTFKSVNDKKMISQTLNDIGLAYNKMGNYDEALENINKALDISKEINDSIGISRAFNNFGSCYQKMGELDVALDYSLKSLKYEEKTNHNALNTISIIYGILQNFDKSLDYQKRALKIREKLEEKDAFIGSLNNMGVIYVKLNKPEKALEYFLKAYKIAEEIGKKSNLNKALNNIGFIYENKLNEPEKALEYYNKSLELSKETNELYDIANTLINIGNVQLKLKKYEDALTNLEQGLILAKQIQVKDFIREAYLFLSNYYYSIGNYKKAFENYKSFVSVKDSIFSKESKDRVAEMQVKYETEKREKENKIYRLQIERSKLQKTRLYLGLAIFLIIVIVLCYFYMLKSKTNKKLKKEIAERKKIENELELRVKERKKDLDDKNRELQREITERKLVEAGSKAMQAQLLQSQKLESIGTLASGVAHEINNPLMGMINYAELINSRINDDTLKEFSASIIEEGDRVAKIVRNLLSFARQDKESHSPASIKDIIEASLSLIGAVLRKDQITLIYDIPKDLPMIKCRSQQIEQVIINLLTNTRDSLNERYPYYDEDKIVKISVKPLEKDGVDWIRTTIEDHGVGMQEDVIERIFDPFFTTKPGDIGTGLGLSVSYGLIKEHGGELSVESEPGKYSRFHIDLPVNNGWQVGNDD